MSVATDYISFQFDKGKIFKKTNLKFCNFAQAIARSDRLKAFKGGERGGEKRNKIKSHF